ncbi:MAG TPA: YtxH domain-containing protein [Armatimonadota bacterium]|jgi:gas vesicle protein|nr:YtxH domain-containing protein [Armatimonadota bacterium]HOM71453.1 YtxH domain-containing protein [Armatimonadota bacterium]HPP75317.1 YtxH domain-containing protein [Armatimonadota bacterium]
MAENEEKSVVVNFLAGVGIGAIIGAGIALLFAPKSGVETREDLKKVAQDLSKSADELKKRSGEYLETAKSKVQQAYGTAQETIQKRRAGEESGDTTT